MQVCVVGGCGYVGSVLSPHLAQSGQKLHLIDLRPPVPGQADHLPKNTWEYIAADMSDAKQAKDLLGKYDAIIHLAALVGYPACQSQPDLAERWNFQTTENILRAKHNKARVIFASTISVYGDQEPGSLVNETSEARPNSVYGETKHRSERILLAGKSHNTVLRFAGSFGCSPRMRHDLLIHDFVSRAARGETVAIYEKSFVRQFVHVQDMVSALLFALEQPKQFAGQIFNVGNPQIEITKAELVSLILKSCPFPHKFEEWTQDLEKRNYRVSFDKLATTGFRPQISLEKGIIELIRHYRSIQPKEELAHVS